MDWDEYKEKIESHLSASEIYGDLPNQANSTNNWITATCPFKEHTHKNAFQYNQDTLQMHCFAGCKGNDVWDYLELKTGKKFQELLFEYGDRFGISRPNEKPAKKNKKKQLGKTTSNTHFKGGRKKNTPPEEGNDTKPKPPIPESLIKEWENNLFKGEAKPILTYLKSLKQGRGLNKETIKKYELGFAHNVAYSDDKTGKNRVTIPIRDKTGKLVNIRLYSPTAKKSGRKMLNYMIDDPNIEGYKKKIGYGSPYRLYGIDELAKYEGNQVIFTGGEFDRLVLQQNGFQAVCSTSGEGKFRQEWLECFKGMDVVILLDCDDAGKEASEKVSFVFTHAEKKEFKSVRVVMLPLKGTKESKDVTDWFKEGHTAEELQKLIHSTKTEKKEDLQDWLVIPDPIKLKFKPARLGKYIIKNYDFAWEDQELFIYRNGVYKKDKASYLESECIRLLGDEFTPARVKDVLYYVSIHSKGTRKLDNEERYINVLNGLLKWPENPVEILPHTPLYRTRYQMPLYFDPKAECPNIKKFLQSVLPNQQTLNLVFELFGYLLIPYNAFEKTFMLVGEGANGKSMFLYMLSTFLGEDNVSNVSLQDLTGNQFDASSLVGKLANIHPDLTDEMIKNSGLFKALISGDGIKVEEKYKKAFTHFNIARLIYSCNELPRTSDVSDAFFRRWVIIRFPADFKEGTPNRIPREELLASLTTKEEMSGMLNESIRGLCRLFINQAFSVPDSSKEELDKYKMENNTVLAFLDEMCVVGINCRVFKTELYSNYCDWCKDNNRFPYSAGKFHKALKLAVEIKEMPRPNSEFGDKRVWLGIGLGTDNFH